MKNRRQFIQAAAGATAISRTVLGANDRVQMGIIGTGNRGRQVHSNFMVHDDVAFVGACDVDEPALGRFLENAGEGITTYGDYRRLLERNDIDAVLITTPDHWHSPIMIDAVQAGKDVYVEKPVSNKIEPALAMVEAVRRSDRVVQVGLQQRSWPHFKECQKMVAGGLLGPVRQTQLIYGGAGGGRRRAAGTPEAEPIPEGFDWEMFQGPAPRHSFAASRRSWRGWYDYGGGSITDWGVHLSDIMTWFMDADRKGPELTTATSMYSGEPDSERVPDVFSITWKYDNFIGTFTNGVCLPDTRDDLAMPDRYGNYFHGPRGVLLVNRYGYDVFPVLPRNPTALGARRPVAEEQEPPIEAKNFRDYKMLYEEPGGDPPSATSLHVRNFLDCVKSRQKPVCDIETGFNSSLPCLIALLAVQTGKAYKWDGKSATPA